MKTQIILVLFCFFSCIAFSQNVKTESNKNQTLHYKSSEAKRQLKPGKVYSLDKEGNLTISVETPKEKQSLEDAKAEQLRLEAIKTKED